MMRDAGLGTVFWFVVLIAISVVSFLQNMAYAVPVWEGLSEYWPSLIIAWGLVKLVDYYRLKGEKRSLFSCVEVVLLVLVLFSGSTFTAATRIGSDLNFLGIPGKELDLFDILGESFEFSRTIQGDAAPGGRIEIHNIYGSVEVEPGDAASIVVEVRLRIRAIDGEEAGRLEPDIAFTIEQRDGTDVIDSNRDDLNDSRNRRFRSSLRVQVPRESQVEVDNKYGTVRITGLTGDQQVRNKFGAVHFTDIVGDMTVENSFSEVVGKNIAGRVLIAGNNSSIDLEDVGAVGIETSYQDVRVQNSLGEVDIVNRHGDVRVSFSESLGADVAIIGEYTNVRVDLLGASNFSLDVRTRQGAIDSDFKRMETIRSGPDQHLVSAIGFRGPDVTIETRLGDVRVARRR